MNYDLLLSDAKAHASKMVVRLVQNDKHGKPLCDGETAHQVACALDDLNKAWDKLTDALVRQRDERDEQIRRLIDELAERRKS